MRHRKWVLGLAAALVAGVTTIGLWWGGGEAPTRHRIVLADANQMLSSLIYVAQAKGYFASQGIDLEIKPFRSGRDAFAAMMAGEADVATAADTPVSNALLAGQPPRIVATIQTNDHYDVVFALKERGLNDAAELAGKRIGMIPGTGAEYLLRLFLVARELQDSGVTVLPVTVKDAPGAVISGEIDALSAWLPIRLAVEKAGHPVTTFDARGLYTQNWMLAVRPDFADASTPALAAMLRSLVAAERFVAENPVEAITIVTQYLKADRSDTEQLWDGFGFAVRLDQTIVNSLGGQIRMKSAPGAEVPDILGVIDPRPLSAVDPSRVTVIR